MSDGQARYLEGVALWSDRNLAEAVETLTSAVENGSSDDQWWHSATRALAQMALELDDPDAERHLRQAQGTGVGDAQNLALRARHWFQTGDDQATILEIHTAATRFSQDTSTDVGSRMNGAMALIWCAEILAEMGLADDASALTTRARARIASAGVDDEVLTAMLGMIVASLARLAIDDATALEVLDEVDTTVSPDLEIKAIRERARMASAAGEVDEASRLYEQSLGLARSAQYVFLERSISSELTAGPPRMRTDRAPIGQWDPRRPRFPSMSGRSGGVAGIFTSTPPKSRELQRLQ